MNFAHIFTDPPILVVIFAFISAMTYCTVKYTQVKKNLNILYQFTSNFKKSDLNYRFKEIDEWMSLNPYVSGIWLEFKNTLVFSESVALKGQNNSLTYKEVSSTIQNIQTTVDPAYFFNEESLVTGKFNNKLMVSWPTILTGLGPLFTFLNIAIAFGKIDFSSQEATIASVANLMSSMQIAALVSVFALCASLIFIVYEKFAYAILCHGPFSRVIGVIGKLFDNISSEKFLLELLKETKIQNNALQHLITELPNHFKVALNSGIAGNLVPYLENLIFGMNLMNKQMKEMAKATKSDAVDDLF
ncbi:TPA: hypothetical protein IAC10_12860 [Candidatus Scatousia excrementigallinarum]|uniref:MotA/TolQ/ExbB proton channel domain-containing protein n=1 Tax=Candidatus Scatousia excrementigallinarum TaxID=2840935 RepID=A0A9D1JNZ3_9BACT|nr:hypothetical protein [Candidatus Scatousia excrementigallinarum]